MKALKDIIEQHTASELGAIIFKGLSTYHTRKLIEALEQADKLARNTNFEEKTVAPEIKPIEVELGINPRDFMIPVGQCVTARIATKEERLIQDEIDGWRKVDNEVSFEINELTGVVKVLIIDKESNEIDTIAKAVCQPSDKFDPNIGKLIALYKANYGSRWKDKLIKLGYGYLFQY